MTEPTDQQRADYVAGLRALAEVLEQHPEVPLPYNPTQGVISFHFLFGENPRADMAATVRALPCRLDKDPRGDDYFDLIGRLHGLNVRLVAFRQDVCTRVVVGTREVEEEVPDPDALAQVPTVTQTRLVEDVEWQCTPLLASAAEGGADRG